MCSCTTGSLRISLGECLTSQGPLGPQSLGASASQHLDCRAPAGHNYMSVHATKGWKKTCKIFTVFLRMVGNRVYAFFFTFSMFTKFSTMNSHCNYCQKN